MTPAAGKFADGMPVVVGLMFVWTKSSEPQNRPVRLMVGSRS